MNVQANLCCCPAAAVVASVDELEAEYGFEDKVGVDKDLSVRSRHWTDLQTLTLQERTPPTPAMLATARISSCQDATAKHVDNPSFGNSRISQQRGLQDATSFRPLAAQVPESSMQVVSAVGTMPATSRATSQQCCGKGSSMQC
jgi:hypothetical protein